MKIIVSITRIMDNVHWEDFALLQEACENGDGQLFHELTEIDTEGTMKVEKIGE